MNWNDPIARAAMIESVGIAEYNRLHREHVEASIVSRVNGYAIRPVGSRYGTLFLVMGTDHAFSKQTEAEDYAATLPPAGDKP